MADVAIFILTNALVGDGVSVIPDQNRAFTIGGAHQWPTMGQADTGNINQRERFGGFPAQRVQPSLHRRHLVGMRSGNVVGLVRIFREVVEVNACGNQRAPDEFPIALAHRTPKRLDVIDNFRAR